MTIKYTLSIEDKVGIGATCTERYVLVEGNNGFRAEASYNPNAETKPFNSKDTEFDTSFSIVHPFRKIASAMVWDYLARDVSSEGENRSIKYDGSIKDAHRRLFENLVEQETFKLVSNPKESARLLRELIARIEAK